MWSMPSSARNLLEPPKDSRGIVIHISCAPNMNGEPERLFPLDSCQKPANFVGTGVKPRSLQICLGLWIFVIKALQERLTVLVDDDAKINRRITQTSTTKIYNPA